MYDEKLIEDSLAFAEEIKAMLEGKKEAGMMTPAQTSMPSQQESQNKSQVQPAPGRVSPAPQGQVSPVQRSQQPVKRTVSPAQKTQQPVQSASDPASFVQQTVRPAPQGQVPPVQKTQQAVKGNVTPAQPMVQAVQQPVQSPSSGQAQPQSRPVHTQGASSPASFVQQTVRPAPQGQVPLVQKTQQAVKGTIPPAQPMAQAVQQPVQSPSSDQAQPQSRPVHTQEASGPAPFVRQTVRPAPQDQVPPVQETQQAVKGNVTPAQPMAQAVQQLVQSSSGSVQPMAQPVQNPSGLVQPMAQAVQQPVQNPSGSVQPMPQAVQQPAQNPSGPVQPMPQAASQTPPVQPQEVPQALQTEETDSRHTYEITIKFDFGNIKKKFGQLKEKLAPETRTLEDVNAAMEENRQLQVERQEQDTKSLVENGAQMAENVAGAVAGAVKKFPKLLKNKKVVPADGEKLSEEGMALDADIVQLEGEAVETGKLAAKLEDVKAALPEKANKASRLFLNVVIVIFCIGIAYFLASFVTDYVVHQTTVEGESMEPTLSDGDSVIIQRLSYYFKDPERYDVIVFPVGNEDTNGKEVYYIKRVIGLPGETVQIIDGSVYVNGSKLTGDKYALSDILESGIAEKPLVLGENQYFVMGDNRNMSTDSRNSYVGLVNKNDIIGEAWICTWPLNHFGSLKR